MNGELDFTLACELVDAALPIRVRVGELEREIVEAWVNRISKRISVRFADGEVDDWPTHAHVQKIASPPTPLRAERGV
jgi:hypothetical protein